MPFAASRPSIATVAAEIGEAIPPLKPAITLIESGRSGRMFPFRATSAITGKAPKSHASYLNQAPANKSRPGPRK